ncbi:MAG: hypothetical protein K0S93_312 [Nitrososphaeraceae archaeon]|jgi:hypothetical protein|nr:hypothetical protein [Nitrososphaeraceae archaeon]
MKILILILLFVLIITTNKISIIHTQNFNNTDTNVFDNLFKNLKDKFSNITRNLEYTVDINANQIFPNDTIKNSVLNKNRQVEYLIPALEYNLLGFDIFATDIKVKTESKNIYENDKNKLRIEFPVMQAKNVKVNNQIFDLNYDNIDLSSTYTIYDSELDKFTIHIPLYVAARYLPK